MPTVLRLRRGDTTSSNAFTGAEGEITIDTTKDTVVVHDGVTTGGKPLATEANLNSGLALKANISSLSTVATSGSYTDLTNKPSIPSLTGYATESYVTSAVNGLINTAPAALDTLNELAAALNNDASFASTITASLASKANTSSLSAVATSGSYIDLVDKPFIPTNNADLTNGSGYITAVDIYGKQDTLVSGTSIKTINSTSLLGSGNIAVQASLVSGTNIKTINSTSLLGSGNIAVQPTLVSGTSIKTVNGNSLLGSGDITISGGGVDYSTLNEIKIGYNAGQTSQGSYAVAIGGNSGRQYQNNYSVAVGYNSGNYSQQGGAVALGNASGNLQQGPNAVALGNASGNSNQNQAAVALGEYAGYSSQGLYAIAIGSNAGYSNQGQYAIAIGAQSGNSSQASNSIVLNATTSALNASAEGFYVKPLRSATAPKIVYYDSVTGEMTYGDPPVSDSGGSTSTTYSIITDWDGASSPPAISFNNSPDGYLCNVVPAFWTNTAGAQALIGLTNGSTFSVLATPLGDGPAVNVTITLLSIFTPNGPGQYSAVVSTSQPLSTSSSYVQPQSVTIASSSGGGGATTIGYNFGGIQNDMYNGGTGYYELTVSSSDAALFATDYNNLRVTLNNLVSSASMMSVSAYTYPLATAIDNTYYYQIAQSQLVNTTSSSILFESMNSTPGIPLSNFPNLITPAGLYVNHPFALQLGGSSLAYSYGSGTCTVTSMNFSFSSNDYVGVLNQAVAAFTGISRIGGAEVIVAGTSWTDGNYAGMVVFYGVSNFVTSGSDLQFSYQTAGTFSSGGPSAMLSMSPRKQ